jgi:hypothetical protein
MSVAKPPGREARAAAESASDPVADTGAGEAALDGTDGAVLRALLAAGPAYHTLPEVRQLTGLGLPALTVRVPRPARLGYVWRLPDGRTGLHCAYHLTVAGAAYARAHPVSV